MPPLGSSSSPRLRLARASSRVALPALERRDVGPQVGDLGVDVLDGVLELEPIGPGLGHQAAHLGLGGRQVRLGRRHGGFLDRDLNLVRLLVELDQQVPLLHAVVVVHQDLAHLAGDPGSHEGHVAVDVGVVGGNRVQRQSPPREPGTTPRPPGRPAAAGQHSTFRKRCDGGLTGAAGGPPVWACAGETGFACDANASPCGGAPAPFAASERRSLASSMLVLLLFAGQYQEGSERSAAGPSG